jgi:YMGG-like Gly-zipper
MKNSSIYKLGSGALGVILLCTAYLAYPQGAPKQIVYPGKGQSADQQAKDEGECHAWSMKSTGIDPAAPPPAVAAPPPQQAAAPSGQRARGAVRGAAAGAVIGEVASNDADEGAKIGAVAGVMAGGRQKRQAEAHAQQQNANAQAQAQHDAAAAQAARMDTFNRARAACLEGKGYVVK